MSASTASELVFAELKFAVAFTDHIYETRTLAARVNLLARGTSLALSGSFTPLAYILNIPQVQPSSARVQGLLSMFRYPPCRHTHINTVSSDNCFCIVVKHVHADCMDSAPMPIARAIQIPMTKWRRAGLLDATMRTVPNQLPFNMAKDLLCPAVSMVGIRHGTLEYEKIRSWV